MLCVHGGGAHDLLWGIMKCRSHSASGAAAVELALVLPLLSLLLFGIIQFGLAFHRQQGMEAAAREGARIAAVGGSLADVQDRVTSALPDLVDSSDVDVTWTNGPCDVAAVTANESVTVNVEIRASERPGYAAAIPFFGTREFSFEAQGVFRCERSA